MTAAFDDDLDVADAALLAALDEALAAAEHKAAARLDYRRGCPACCIGPFPITSLDAHRLRRGLAALALSDPARAAAVRARASQDVAVFTRHFPGDAATGRLSEDEQAEETFCARFAERPCPALDPRSGRCELYAFRPVSCRTYGPPVAMGATLLPPCERCFPGCADDEAERCRARIDPEGLEAELLRRLAVREADARETLVAFALNDARVPR